MHVGEPQPIAVPARPFAERETLNHYLGIGHGRHSTVAFVSENLVMGVDIGGTGIKGAPVDIEKGELARERDRILTPHPSTAKAVAEVVGEVVEHFQWKGP